MSQESIETLINRISRYGISRYELHHLSEQQLLEVRKILNLERHINEVPAPQWDAQVQDDADCRAYRHDYDPWGE